MRTLFECDLENERLAEKGVMFTCLNRRFPLRIMCPYVARTPAYEGDETK